MCGICGFITKQTITSEELKVMNDTMYHRGPNDSGEEIFQLENGYSLGLAQRRLSILDLSSLGHQPMHSPDQNVSIVYNGECYNFQSLRKELSDYTFVSNCDTEVIIAAYLKWGISCVQRLKGMFAMAIYDRKLQTLFLVRDRIGKKPLYYWYEHGNVVFASELKPIMETPGFQREINQNVMKKYMFHGYIQAPETIFKHVYKLEPGCIATFQGGNLTTEQYWNIATVYGNKKQTPIKSYEAAKSGLKERLVDAVEERMIADVPVGTFLSGGYDSSLITAMAQNVSNRPVKTFSIGFNEERFNEAKYAKEVANYLGTDHTEYYINEQEMFDLVEDLPKYYDEPFADSSQIPTMLVSKLAREKVTVALSGDGGDEFFCGYSAYGSQQKAQKLDFAGGLVYGMTQLPGLKQLGVLDQLPFLIRMVARNRNPLTKTQYEGDHYISVIDKMLLVNGKTARYEIEDRYEENNWQIRKMLLDMDTYLPGDILCKVDRASMKYSLETRCPILDTDVMEYSFQIPHEFKYHEGNRKHILKDIAHDYVPFELLNRPKVGFGVPKDKWLRGTLSEELRTFSNEHYLKKQGIFDWEYTNKFVNQYLEHGDNIQVIGQNYSTIIWSFYMFQKWYEHYICS